MRGQTFKMYATSRRLSVTLPNRPSHRLPRTPCHACRRHFASSRSLAVSRRSTDFNSGFTGSYDPSIENGRGPMFNKSSFGVPQFYPRDLKKRVDDYVVGQDRAKKTICATLFNHYQGVRRRHQQDHEERNRRDKQTRQRLARDRELHQRRREVHPVEGQRGNDAYRRHVTDEYVQDDFPGHQESLRHLHEEEPEENPFDSLYQPEDPSAPEPVKIDKSNMLLIGPTGVGKTYILE